MRQLQCIWLSHSSRELRLNQVHVMQAAGQEVAQVNKPLPAPHCKADNDD